jgi:gamma-glutamylcyclotransferase (GGCT)/AIG2-like uncharacterized protein YtfP
MNLVAVYGTLRKGSHNHRLLTLAEPKGEFITPPKFTMFSAGGFPYLVEDGSTGIKCEVYRVSEKTLKELDRLEGVDHGHYRRGSIETPYGTATIYLATESTKKHIHNLPVVESGDWMKRS